MTASNIQQDSTLYKVVETLADGIDSFAHSVSNAVFPYKALPNDNKVAHYAREAFALLLKGTQFCVYVGFIAYAAPISVIPLALAILGVASYNYRDTLISALPERVQDVAAKFLYVCILGAAVVGTVTALNFYTWTILIPAVTTMITYLALAFLRSYMERTLVIGKEGEAIDAQKITADLQTAIDSKRSLESVRIIHSGATIQLNEEDLEALKTIQPNNIFLKGCEISNNFLDNLNAHLCDKYYDKLKNLLFYYVVDTTDGTQLNGISTKPQELTLRADADPDQWKNVNSSKVEQFLKLKQQYAPSIKTCVIIKNIKPEEKIVLSARHVDLLLAVAPEKVECKDCSLDKSAEEEMNTMRLTADGQHYYCYHDDSCNNIYLKKTDSFYINSDSLLTKLQSLHNKDIPLELIKIKHKGEAIQLEDEVLKLLCKLSSKQLFIDKGCQITEDQMLMMIRELNKDRKVGDDLFHFNLIPDHILRLQKDKAPKGTYECSTADFFAFKLKKCLLLTELSHNKFDHLIINTLKYDWNKMTPDIIPLLQQIDAKHIEILYAKMSAEQHALFKQTFGDKITFKSMANPDPQPLEPESLPSENEIIQNFFNPTPQAD